MKDHRSSANQPPKPKGGRTIFISKDAILKWVQVAGIVSMILAWATDAVFLLLLGVALLAIIGLHLYNAEKAARTESSQNLLGDALRRRKRE